MKGFDEHTRYLGALGLLGECAVYVPEDLREMITAVFNDACSADADLHYRRIVDRFEITVKSPPPAQLVRPPSSDKRSRARGLAAPGVGNKNVACFGSISRQSVQDGVDWHRSGRLK